MHDGVEIHYLTKNSFKSLLEPNPYLSMVYGIDKSTNEVLGELKDERYDYVIDLHVNLRSMNVKRSLKMLSFEFNKCNFQKWILVNFGLNRMPKVHVVDRYMETLKAFQIENDNKGLDYFFHDNERPVLPKGYEDEYIVIVIGAAHFNKKPRVEQYIELCQKIRRKIVLVGGSSEAKDGERIANECGSKVWSFAGKTSLDGSAALLRDAQLVITPDTGMMHIAAALKKPIISLWGCTVPDFGMYPYQNNNLDVRIEASHLKKRPCSKLGDKCKYKGRCIDELPLQRVVDIANSQKEPSVR